MREKRREGHPRCTLMYVCQCVVERKVTKDGAPTGKCFPLPSDRTQAPLAVATWGHSMDMRAPTSRTGAPQGGGTKERGVRIGVAAPAA